MVMTVSLLLDIINTSQQAGITRKANQSPDRAMLPLLVWKTKET